MSLVGSWKQSNVIEFMKNTVLNLVNATKPLLQTVKPLTSDIILLLD